MPSSYLDIQAQAADWIAARDGDRWTPDRQCALDAWLSESPLHRVTYLRLDGIWRRADRLQALRAPRPARGHWQLRPRPRAWLAPAAWLAPPAWLTPRAWQAGFATVTVTLAALGALLAWPSGERQATEIGERKTLSLADGSRLTLNTATRLRIEVGQAERRVWLDDGEAYFDIAHDPVHPFEVRAGAQRVRVIGTRFTVHRQDDRVQVAVLEGKVEVQRGGAAPVALVAGEKAVLADSEAVVRRQTMQRAAAQIGWLEGELVFERTPLEDAAASFNRYNRKQLRIDDPQTAGIAIGGTFGATNVEAFARLLRSSFALDVRERGEQIIVTRGRAGS